MSAAPPPPRAPRPPRPQREALAARLQAGPLSVREATQICRALLTAIESASARGASFGPITLETIVWEEGRLILPAESVAAPDSLANDLFAAGAVLYESVSGRPWRAGDDPKSADWSRIPARLRRALRRALSGSPGQRWPDAAAFQRALWVPRPQHPIWPAIAVVVLAAAIITAVALCKPLGLCWERQPAQAAPASTRNQ